MESIIKLYKSWITLPPDKSLSNVSRNINGILTTAILGPFIRGKIRRVLHKTCLKQDANCTIYTSMSYLIRRVLATARLILDKMCRLYGKFASYLRRLLCKTRLIFPRINGPNVSAPSVSTQGFILEAFKFIADHPFVLLICDCSIVWFIRKNIHTLLHSSPLGALPPYIHKLT